MATIVTRAGKGSPLTNSEVDANFTNLNTDKLETVPVASASTSGTVKIGAGVSIDGAGVLTSTGATNLSNTPASTNVALESSTGANTTLPAATTVGGRRTFGGGQNKARRGCWINFKR